MSIKLDRIISQFVPRNGQGFYYFINPDYVTNKMGGSKSKQRCIRMIETIKELHGNKENFNSHIFIPKGVKSESLMVVKKKNDKDRYKNNHESNKFRECTWPVISSVLTTIKEDPYGFTNNFEINEEDEDIGNAVNELIEHLTGNTTYMCGGNVPQSFFDRGDEKEDGALIILKFNKKKEDNQIDYKYYSDCLVDFFSQFVTGPDDNALSDSRIIRTLYKIYENDEDNKDLLVDTIKSIYESITYTCTALGIVHDKNYYSKENYLYINGVCSNEKGVGKTIIDNINWIGYKGTYKGTKLASLTYVIPYYWKYFNFRFKNDKRTNYLKVDKDISELPLSRTDDGIFSKNGGQKYVNLIQKIYSKDKNNASDDVKIPMRYLKKIYKKEKPGAWSEKKGGPWFKNWWDDVNNISLPTRGTGKLFEDIEVGDQGWYMYFDFTDRPYYDHEPILKDKFESKLSEMSKKIMNETASKTKSKKAKGKTTTLKKKAYKKLKGRKRKTKNRCMKINV
jgi:hypothetical protein